jgi:hypothetical protein
MASLVLVGVSVVAGTFGVLPSASRCKRRVAVATYPADPANFKAATDRPVGAPGVNLDAAEARRRARVLNSLVLDRIDAVNGYNRDA